jgi:type II secretory pathway component PulF
MSGRLGFMLSYTFRAKTDGGLLVSGDMLAERPESVINVLKQKGYFPISVRRENRLVARLRAGTGLGTRVSTREKAVFTHQLATLLRAGVQLSMALKTLSKQTESRYLASIVRQLDDDIEQSSSLSEAMTRHPRVFSPTYAAIVAAAEESGTLAETLAVLSNQLKTQAAVSARIQGALVYPLFLLVVSALVVAVLTVFVIPKFIELFVNANQALPLPTRMLVTATDFLKHSWWVLAVGAVGLAAFAAVASRHERVCLALDHLLLQLPLAGTLNRKLQLARFTRTLGSLLNGGVRIVTAVATTQGTTSNRAFRREIAGVEQAILKGATLAQGMGQQHYFSEIAMSMVAVGEDSGTLPEMLLEVADLYDQECETAIGAVTSLLGPIMIVLLGGIIGFVVMAILLPIFQTSTMVR